VTGRVALARVRSARGRHEDAIRLAREAVELFAEAESPDQSGDVWITFATALHAAGRTAEASDAARRALGFFERKGNKLAVTSTQAFLITLEA
jgi:tetratricopeptide (TPR) repeat protein